MKLLNDQCLGIELLTNTPYGDRKLFFKVMFNGQEVIANAKDIIGTFENVFATFEDNGDCDLLIKQEDGSFKRFSELTNNVQNFQYSAQFEPYLAEYLNIINDIKNSNRVVEVQAQINEVSQQTSTEPSTEPQPSTETESKSTIELQPTPQPEPTQKSIKSFIDDTIETLNREDTDYSYTLNATDKSSTNYSVDLNKEEHNTKSITEHNNTTYEESFTAPIYLNSNKVFETTHSEISISNGTLNIKIKG